MLLEEYTILQTAIDTWGRKLQIEKACEELSELIGALMRLQCEEGTKRCQRPDARAEDVTALWENVTEEIADVEIMLAQLKLMFDHNDVERERIHKLRRLAGRLGLTGPDCGEERWQDPRTDKPKVGDPVLATYLPLDGAQPPRDDLIVVWDGEDWVYWDLSSSALVNVSVRLLGWMPLPAPAQL